MKTITDILMFYIFLQSSSEEENEKAFLILNEMILTLKDVNIRFASLLLQFVGV